MLRKIVFTTLFIIWLIIIFAFSQASGTKSSQTSNAVIKNIVIIINKIQNKEVTSKDLKIAYQKYSFIIRKAAHFTEYFILGIFSYMCINSHTDKRVMLISLIFCLIYASTDEIHQLFIDGRGARFMDVLIDGSGSALSLFLIKLKKRHN